MLVLLLKSVVAAYWKPDLYFVCSEQDVGISMGGCCIHVQPMDMDTCPHASTTYVWMYVYQQHI